MNVSWSTPEPVPVNVVMTLQQALAVAAALRMVHSDDLVEDGMRPAIAEQIEGVFDSMDEKLTAELGTDWLFLTNTEESLAEETEDGTC